MTSWKSWSKNYTPRKGPKTNECRPYILGAFQKFWGHFKRKLYRGKICCLPTPYFSGANLLLVFRVSGRNQNHPLLERSMFSGCGIWQYVADGIWHVMMVQFIYKSKKPDFFGHFWGRIPLLNSPPFKLWPVTNRQEDWVVINGPEMWGWRWMMGAARDHIKIPGNAMLLNKVFNSGNKIGSDWERRR